MNWIEMSAQQRFDTLRTMFVRGGGFASKLADAWMLADSGNADALARAFPDLVRRYGPGSAIHLTPEAVHD